MRLIGPALRWARPDGGEAGLHPSNLHDNAYAIGALDFTCDMPIILGPDGPSLGGFVCPAVIARDEQWKMGQMRPGDRVRFVPVARPGDPAAGPRLPPPGEDAGSPIVRRDGGGPVPVAYRRQGDDNLLVEYGPMTLDIALRLRVRLLAEAVAAARVPGLIDLTPGIRSLQIHYDGTTLTRGRLLTTLAEIERSLPDPAGVVGAEPDRAPAALLERPRCRAGDAQVPGARAARRAVVSRQHRVHPPHQRARLGARCRASSIVFDGQLPGARPRRRLPRGAPVATPVDPRHRLVTTKYNPARTWTPENAVGIGGAYMCIYGMEGPGGYQLFGRTIQVWNTWRRTAAFAEGTPWLLRCFDQIRFFPVSHAELTEARAAFPHGGYPIRIEETRFAYADHAAGLAREADGIAAFEARRQAAFEAERRWWKETGLDSFQADQDGEALSGDLPAGCAAVATIVPGQVWKFVAAVGDGIAIIESMKWRWWCRRRSPAGSSNSASRRDPHVDAATCV